jgi:ADP-ribosyl-[dinitrogen reductase] hydrolase
VSSVTSSPDLRDRFRGALLGLAVGEALGAPAEFLSAEQVVERYGFITEMIGGGCHDVAPGQTTDATDMTLRLAQSLAERGDHDPEDVMRRYREWFEGHPRDVSLTVRTVLLSYHAGTPWDLASRRAYEVLGHPVAGNGSLMRCAPLALLFHADAARRREAMEGESMLTHFDRLAGWACVAFGDLLAAALHGRLQEELPAIADDLEDEDRRISAALRDAALAEPEEVQNSAFVVDSLRTALWAVLRSATFEETICLVVNLGDDADTVGAVTGALAGALYGEAGIPARWLAPLGLREPLRAVADRLADRAGV